MADALARLARMSPWWAKAWFQGIRGARAGASRRLNLRLDTAGVVGVRRRKAREIGDGKGDAGGDGASDGASGGGGLDFLGAVCAMCVA